MYTAHEYGLFEKISTMRSQVCEDTICFELYLDVCSDVKFNSSRSQTPRAFEFKHFNAMTLKECLHEVFSP